jgi:hypothetical protein
MTTDRGQLPVALDHERAELIEHVLLPWWSTAASSPRSVAL